MDYHKVTYDDCLSVATPGEKALLDNIDDIWLLKTLAQRWCSANGYKLGGYLGKYCWDSTRK